MLSGPSAASSVEWLNFSATCLAIFVGGFIAYHIYFLQRRLSFRAKMDRRAEVQRKIDLLLSNIRSGGSSKVELLNVRRYPTDYPHDNSMTKRGYTYFAGELKGYGFEGVEIIHENRQGYQRKDGMLTFNKTKKPVNHAILVSGVIPYEWIEYVDVNGDDTSGRPQLYTHFKGPKHEPFYKEYFYVVNEDYDKTREPLAWLYKAVDVEATV